MPTEMVSSRTLYLLLPEILLAAVATSIYIGGAMTKARGIWSWVGAGGIAVAAIALWRVGGQPEVSGPLSADAFSVMVRWLTLGVGLLFVMLMAAGAAEGPASEIVGSVLMVLTGTMLVACSQELVLLFVGLELISLPTYLLLYIGRHDRDSQESAVKYFYLSILSSAVLLYGFSFLYGVAGSTRLSEISARVMEVGSAPAGLGALGSLALVLIVAGLGFKIAAVPFHFYAPDVYQGTTNANAGLLSVLPKIAGFVALVRVVAVAMQGLMDGQNSFSWALALILAVLTMTIGNCLALWQDNIRRLLAYSSIAHAGYMLIGLAVALAAAGGAQTTQTFDGITALLVYLCVYALATTGTFAALAYLSSEGRQVDGVEELAGVGRTHPVIGAALAVFMLSLAGIPPLAGFWGKLSLFFGASAVDATRPESVLRTWFLALVVVGVINAAIAAAYYLRIIVVAYFRAPRAALRAEGGAGAWTATVVAMALVLAIGVFPKSLVTNATFASREARRMNQAELTIQADQMSPADLAQQTVDVPQATQTK